MVGTRRRKKQNKNVKKKKEHKCEAVPAGTAVRGHSVNDGKPVSERARIRGAGEDMSRVRQLGHVIRKMEKSSEKAVKVLCKLKKVA